MFKRGALALGVVMVVATYGFKAKDWTKGLISSFIVYGQSASSTNSVTDNRSAIHIFAQVADGVFGDGSSYRSTLVVQSDASSPVTCTATLVGLTISGFGDGQNLSINLAAGGIAVVD